MTTKETKYFDKEGKECKQEDAENITILTIDDSGNVIESQHFVAA